MYSPRQYAFDTVTPGGYASLMDLYENNYLRLKKLLPTMGVFTGESISHIDGCLDLHIALLESSRYTSSYRLTYYFPGDTSQARLAEPDISLRVYHDAGLVEVLSGHLQHGRIRLNHLPADSLRVKWKMNRFLYRWLGFCLYMGHQFPAEKTPEVVLLNSG